MVVGIYELPYDYGLIAGGAMRSLMQLLKDKDPVLSKNFVSWRLC